MDFWGSFWDIIWWFLWIFAFTAYLFALFAVISDLFRDHKLNGWWKAVWMLFLIFVPFLTVLIYLIARGNGMAERSREASSNAKAAAEAYIQQVAAGGSSPSDEISKAQSLFDSGVITAEELQRIKQKVLS